MSAPQLTNTKKTLKPLILQEIKKSWSRSWSVQLRAALYVYSESSKLDSLSNPISR